MSPLIWFKRHRLRRALKVPPRRLNLGAANTVFPGWQATDIDTLNLLSLEDWSFYSPPGGVDALMSEHVWEHLTPDQGLTAASLCREFLKPGGNFRIAVPDGFNPNPAYREHVRVGGSGPGADDHKVLYTHVSLTEMLRAAGFVVQRLEYWDARGRFHHQDWDPESGMIRRSRRFDPRNQDGKLEYTSLILDARRPA